MKQLLTFIFIIFSVFGSAQSSHKMENQLKEYYKQVKTFRKNPNYIMEMQNDAQV